MTDADSARARPRRPPAPPRGGDRLGWGVWVLVAVCLVLGGALLVALRARVPRAVPPADTAAGPEAGQAAAPTAAPAPAPSAPSPPAGEGHVTRSPQEGLRVLWAKPPRAVPVFPNATIEVRFSAPMDRASVQSNVEIAPPVPGTFEWPRPDQMEFRPRRLLEMGAEYTVAVSAFAHDPRGKAYLVPYTWTFAVHKAYRFRQNVGRVIRHGCGTCHRSGGTAAQAPLGSYPEVMRYVRKGNAAASPLVAALGNPRTHGQVPADWQAMYYVIRDWIDKFDAAE